MNLEYVLLKTLKRPNGSQYQPGVDKLTDPRGITHKGNRYILLTFFEIIDLE